MRNNINNKPSKKKLDNKNVFSLMLENKLLKYKKSSKVGLDHTTLIFAFTFNFEFWLLFPKFYFWRGDWPTDCDVLPKFEMLLFFCFSHYLCNICSCSVRVNYSQFSIFTKLEKSERLSISRKLRFIHHEIH